ncbi:hypothetical protein DFJ58DRAFT_847502 [Suillus subalutaceus]|uniref:uncharacterized protein n=1 Tax=Suillus subalutaceus TaxID=48586 RepID=UPI001B870FEF|nr:uncharacterized protein DFJ58DRAFT_847502 [Suillus subalutaceus]KAG1834972.1 hypothetical protein DFJ58DRAFT_847502 [Suillus subalutaceus]
MASTRSKGQVGANTKSKKTTTVTKLPVIARVKQNGLHRTGSSTSAEDETADDTASEWTKPVKKKRKRGDGAADILTIFKLINDDDPLQGYICEPCVELCEANSKKHSKLQTIFKGNNTATHTHIQCMGMSHYCQYQEKCVQQNIDMDERCVPQEELDRLEGKAPDTQHSILDFTETMKPMAGPQYTNDGLQEHIIRFVLETDQVQNITADNVSVNDKSLRVLGKKLRNESHDFNATAQHPHCFSHAVALAEGAFLTKLSPSVKKKNSAGMDEDVPVIPPPPDDMSMGDIDASKSSFRTSTEGLTVPASQEVLQEVLRRCARSRARASAILLNAITQENNSDDVPNVDKNQRKYASYRVSDTEWDLLTMIRKVFAAAADVQEAFSAEYYPTIWRILPLYKDFIIRWQTFSEDPKMAAGITNLEKYYNKTDNSPAHIVSISQFLHKDEYFNVAWTEDGQRQAFTVMEKCNDRIPMTEPGSSESSNGFGSLMSRVTEGRHARKKLITKDSHAELKSYIEEPLIVNDQWSSPEHQAEHILKWWKANLWDDIVRLVVENLGGLARPGSQIWWCPTSVFNFLPLHAAGQYWRDGQFLS